MAVDPQAFKEALSRWASGVTVVTTTAEDGDHGMTASAFTSVSLDPPLVLVCIKRTSAMAELVRTAGGFAVSLLAQDQERLSGLFAGFGGVHGPDRFLGLDEHRLPVSGARSLPGALAWLDCLVHEVVEAGDHAVVLGRVEGGAVGGGTPAPLIYFHRAYRKLADG